MANITSQNPIRFQIDTLNTESYGVLYTTSTAINLSNAQYVTGITIGGSQPAHTARYIAFCVNGQWGKINSNGTFSAFSLNSPTYDNIASFGNTPASLTVLTSIPGLAAQRFGVAFAMMAEDPDTYGVPSCSIAFSTKNDSQILTTTEYSPVYELGDNAQIIKLSADTATANGGSVTVQSRATYNDGTVSDWAVLDAFTGQKAKAVEFRGVYSASNVGSSSAVINDASILYSDGNSIMNGTSSGELLSITQDWYLPIRHCRLTVKHAPLEFADISAYVVLRPSPVQVKREQLGIGSGAKKVFQLANLDGIKYDTFKLYFDNVQVFTDYELNCEAGRVTCEAPEGVIVSCDYEHGWNNEEWQQMTLESRLDMDNLQQSEFRYSKPDSDSEHRSVCALKIVMSMSAGSITSERLGTSTGRRQSFRLSRRIRDGQIRVFGNGSTLAQKYWTLLDDPQYIAVTAPAGQSITARYDWISETPAVYEFYAVYAE